MFVRAPLKACSKPPVVVHAQMMCAPLAVESGFKQETYLDKVREQHLSSCSVVCVIVVHLPS
jgi:hypothetical protein